MRIKKIHKFAQKVWGKEGSGILLVTDDEVLLQLRSKSVTLGDCWAPPGGAIEETDGEYDSDDLGDYKPVSIRHAYESAVRELEEEGLKSNIDFKKKKWKDKLNHKKDHFLYRTFIVPITDKEKEKIKLDSSSDEVKKWEWFEKDEIPKKLHPGFKELVEGKFGKKHGFKIKGK